MACRGFIIRQCKDPASLNLDAGFSSGGKILAPAANLTCKVGATLFVAPTFFYFLRFSCLSSPCKRDSPLPLDLGQTGQKELLKINNLANRSSSLFYSTLTLFIQIQLPSSSPLILLSGGRQISPNLS